MLGTSPTGRRLKLKGFRLADIPKGVRLDAYDKLIKTEGSKDGLLVTSRTLSEKVDLGLAAEVPSERVCWVTLEAWERVAKSRRWRTAAAQEGF